MHYAVREEDAAALKALIELDDDRIYSNIDEYDRGYFGVKSYSETPFHLAKSEDIVRVFCEKYIKEKDFGIPKCKTTDGTYIFYELLRNSKEVNLAEIALDYLIKTNDFPLDSKELVVDFDLKSFQTQMLDGNANFLMTYHKYMNDFGSQLIYPHFCLEV